MQLCDFALCVPVSAAQTVPVTQKITPICHTVHILCWSMTYVTIELIIKCETNCCFNAK